MKDDLSLCLVLNTRKAARAVTRRADRQLKPFGVSAAQFNILGALHQQSWRSVTDMAKGLSMERTTLSRNLDVLARKGLVKTLAPAQGMHANTRVPDLTETGAALIEEILPEWRKAQAELRASLRDPDFDDVLAMLRQVSGLK